MRSSWAIAGAWPVRGPARGRARGPRVSTDRSIGRAGDAAVATRRCREPEHCPRGGATPAASWMHAGRVGSCRVANVALARIPANPRMRQHRR
eukprot:2034178-Prymnesium_polylepis.1